MNLNLQKYPLLRMALMFGSGIYIAWKTGPFPSYHFLPPFVFVLWTLSLALHSFLKSYALRWLPGLSIHLLFLSLGFWAAISSMPRPVNFDEADALVVRLTEPLSERKNAFRAIAEVRASIQNEALHAASGKILVYLRKEGQDQLPGYGDHLIIFKKPQRVDPPLNPGQFDFSLYLARKGVLHQVFLDKDHWKSLGFNSGNPLFRLAYRTRDHFVEILSENGLKGDEFAVASAILLGYNEMLSHELRKGYTGAGAMHVLCVSGLHVGIIYLLFGLMLSFLDRYRKGRYLKGALLLIIIWFYAFVTGLSPSVMRASLMISFLLLGQMLRRRGQAMNTLAAAAMVILMIDTASLFSIGFQLSFAAVAGILLFQRPLASLLAFRNKAANYFWEATTVALAAQLSTTPLVLYYFNQFPFYFWLSNLFLTPLSFMVIFSGMALLLLSPLPFLPQLLGWITSALIYAMNLLITWVEGLPFAVWKHLYINWFEALTLVTALPVIAYGLNSSRRKVIIPVLSLMVLIAGSILVRQFQNLKKQGLVVYGIPGHTAISFVNGRQHVLVADSSLLANEQTLEFNMGRFWNSKAMHHPVEVRLDQSFQNNFIFKEGAFIAFSGQLIRLQEVGSAIPVNEADIMLVYGSSPRAKTDLTGSATHGLVVLDASLRPATANRLREAAVRAGLPYHDVHLQGAYLSGIW